MAFNMPLLMTNFFDLFDIRLQKFSLSESIQMSTNGGGHLLTASLGSRLWTGEVSLVVMSHQDMALFASRVELLLESGNSFLAYDKRAAFPKSDPTGSILGASAVTLTAVDVNNVDITLGGLPASYVLTSGDMLAFTYGSSPVRYALHRIVNGGTASGGGSLVVQVIPAIRPGYTLGVAVDLNKPRAKMKIIPGSYVPPEGSPGKLSSGISFQFVQTLR